MSKMRLLLIDNAGLVYRNKRFCCVEGTGKFAAELVERGVEVTMFGQKVALETNVSVFDIEAHGIKTAGLWRRKNKYLNYLGLYLYALKFIIQSDFVYIFYPNAFRYLALVCFVFGKKYGLYIRGNEGIEDKVSLKIYKRATVALTVSPMFTNMVNRVTNSQKAQSIRPMVAYDDSDIVYDRVYTKTHEEFNLLFLCRIQEKKGILELLDALQSLNARGISCFKLTVAGDGDFLIKAQEYCSKCGLDDRVSFLGGIYDNDIKAKLYKDADLYILPTYFNEGFPRTLYEAMIFGVPILTTFVAGIPALMKDGENCLKIEPRSSNSITEALLYAFKNYEDMGRMANKATQLVASIINRARPSHANQLYQIINDNGES